MAGRPQTPVASEVALRFTLASVAAALLLSACLEGSGDACKLDSDCEAGLACSPVGHCVPYDGLEASFDDFELPSSGEPEVPDVPVTVTSTSRSK